MLIVNGSISIHHYLIIVLTSAFRDNNQIFNPEFKPTLNSTFASQTEIVRPNLTTCIYAFPYSRCSSSSTTEPIFTEIIDGPNDTCVAWNQDISFGVISVLFWLGDQGAQSITFYDGQNCANSPKSILTTDPYQWSCYFISSVSSNKGSSLLSYKALYA